MLGPIFIVNFISSKKLMLNIVNKYSCKILSRLYLSATGQRSLSRTQFHLTHLLHHFKECCLLTICVVFFEMLELISTILSQDRQANWVTAKRNEKSNVINVVR